MPPGTLEAAHVVVSDYQMADVDGISFADAVHTQRPDLSIVLATAYSTVDMEAEIAARRAFLRLCREPLDYDELHALVHELASVRRGGPASPDRRQISQD